MSDSDRDLDDAFFDEESFPNQLKWAKSGGGGQEQQTQSFGRNSRSVGVDTIINFETEDDFFFDNETNTETMGKSVGVQKDFGYADQTQQMQEAQTFQYVGLEQWLKKIEPKITEILELNVKNNIFANYKTKDIDIDADMDDDDSSHLKVFNKLMNPYDFAEANKAIQNNLKKQRDADKQREGQARPQQQNQQQQQMQQENYDDDDFDDDFNEAFNDEFNDQPPKQQKQQINSYKPSAYNTNQSSKHQYATASAPKPTEAQLAEYENKFPATCISWSKNGASLAVAYGKVDHTSWCEHQSIVSVWNIFRNDHDANKPTATIEVSCCLTTLSYHPDDPLILAGGNMNGEIFIWDTNEDSKAPVIQKSEPDEYFHREAISNVEWLKIENANGTSTYYLISISTDGKVLLWFNPMRGLKFPIRGHMLAQVKSYGGDLESYQYLGGSSLGVVKSLYGTQETALLLGTNGGQVQRMLMKHPTMEPFDVFKGGMITWSGQAQIVLSNVQSDKKTLTSLKNQVDSYMNDRKNRFITQWKKSGLQTEIQVYPEHIFNAKLPIIKLFPPFQKKSAQTFVPHNGPVTSISPHPFKEYNQLFLSASSDGQIRINDIKQNNKVVLTFEPKYGEFIHCVEWSPVRPAVFVAVSDQGTLYVYDLVQSKQKPSVKLDYIYLDNDGSTHMTPIRFRQAQKVSFNPRYKDQLAICYHDGCVRTVKLGGFLSSKNTMDNQVMQKLIEKDKKTENEF